MTGSLEHLGGNKWKVRVYAGQDANDRQHQRTKNFRAPNLQAARRAMPKIAAQLREEIEAGIQRKETVAGLADDWLALKRDRGRSPSTLVNYQRHAARIVQRFGKMRPEEITGRDIDRWYAELKRSGMSDANILHHHATLRMILRQGERWGMVSKIATRQATPPDRVKPTLTLPTGAAIGVIMGSVSGDLAVALHVLAATGVRRGELVGLQWTDIDGDHLIVQRSVLTLQGGGWLVKSTKGKRPRRVQLDPDTSRRLLEHAQSVAARNEQLGVVTPWMFPDYRTDRTGKTPHRPGWLSGEWGKLRKRHGATSVRLHDLRHWHASVLIRRGVDFTEISDRLGHAQTSTTMDIYGHLLPDKGGRAAAAIGLEMGELPS